jgi:hypothetical protein
VVYLESERARRSLYLENKEQAGPEAGREVCYWRVRKRLYLESGRRLYLERGRRLYLESEKSGVRGE